MSAPKLLALMVVGTVAVIAFGRRAEPAKRRPAARALVDQGQWLSREATSQLIDPVGRPGTLFATLTLGGAAPTALEREQIAAFARANDVEIELDATDDTLDAIRVAVHFGGCCGYEGAETLARRASQPPEYHGCMGIQRSPDDWTAIVGDVHVTGALRVNRIELTWRRALGVAETMIAAENLVGQSIHSLRAHWRLAERSGGSYRLELPASWQPGGVELVAAQGVVHTVELRLPYETSDDDLRAVWGAPRVRDGDLVWTHGGHGIVRHHQDEPGMLEITMQCKGC